MHYNIAVSGDGLGHGVVFHQKFESFRNTIDVEKNSGWIKSKS